MTKTKSFCWRRVDLEQLETNRQSSNDETRSVVSKLVDRVRREGEPAVRELSVEFGDIAKVDQQLVFSKSQLLRALDSLDSNKRSVLERVADRIRSFAQAQRESLQDCEVPIPGGVAGHRWSPLSVAGCYAPGGRYPLPSSVLMTAVTARVAGVEKVWVASPKPTLETRAAAAIAGADGLLAIGGAQAIAAMAFGSIPEVPRCDVIVGPGNRWVTAAKGLVADQVRIDMLAGPSELVVVADSWADPKTVAADLLAQAEHDDDACPILITDCEAFAVQVGSEIESQLETLPTASTAQAALTNGGFIIVEQVSEAVQVCDRLAPEHLSLQGRTVEALADSFRVCGSLFVGALSGEVMGDYGVGPNHVLPTGGTARFQNPLWVGSFMRFHTFTNLNDSSAAQPAINDAVELGRMEGLEAHARSAEIRLQSNS